MYHKRIGNHEATNWTRFFELLQIVVHPCIQQGVSSQHVLYTGAINRTMMATTDHLHASASTPNCLSLALRLLQRHYFQRLQQLI